MGDTLDSIKLTICFVGVWAVGAGVLRIVMIKTNPKEGEDRTRRERLDKAWMYYLLFGWLVIMASVVFHMSSWRASW